MEYIPAIMKGLLITLLISLLSLCISVIPGYLVYLGKKSKIKVWNFICTAYIELFEGIPLIVQLFFVYYALPMVTPILTFSQYTTAIIVLTLNAIANMASFGKSQVEVANGNERSSKNIKIAVLSAILVLRRIIKYTSLLSILGLTELFRSANIIMSTMSNIYIIIVAIGIYLVLSISLKIVYKSLKSKFFGFKTVEV